MTPLVIAWLLLVGALFGVMATLAYQWWGDRRPRVELDDYTARLRALNRTPLMGLQERGMEHVPGVEPPPPTDEYLMEHLRKANREGWL